MASMTFTDALMQAKRASQLRGTPFTTTDTSNLQSAYMSGAAERAAGGRAAALSEKTLQNQKRNFADTLATEKDLANKKLIQDKGLADATITSNTALSDATNLSNTTISNNTIAANKKIFDEGVIAKANEQRLQFASDAAIAAKKAISDKEALDAKIAADKIISDNDIQAKRDAQIAQLTQEKELTGLSNDQARWLATAQIDAQGKQADKSLWGNIASTAAMIGGAWLMSPDKTPPPKETTLDDYYASVKDLFKTPAEEPPVEPPPAELVPPPLEPPAYVYEGPTVTEPPPEAPPPPATLEPPAELPPPPDTTSRYLYDEEGSYPNPDYIAPPPSVPGPPPPDPGPPPEMPERPLSWREYLDNYLNERGISEQNWREHAVTYITRMKPDWQGTVDAYPGLVDAYNNYDWEGYKAYYDYENAGMGDVGPGGGTGRSEEDYSGNPYTYTPPAADYGGGDYGGGDYGGWTIPPAADYGGEDYGGWDIGGGGWD